MKTCRAFEPSSGPWNSYIVIVKNKDNSTIFCVDYRKLNDVTKKTVSRNQELTTSQQKRRGSRYWIYKKGIDRQRLHTTASRKLHSERTGFAIFDRIKLAVKDWHRLQNLHKLRSFWDYTHITDTVQKFARVPASLYELTKKSKVYQWVES